MQDSSLTKSIAATPQVTAPAAPIPKGGAGPRWRTLWGTQRLYWRQTLAVFAFALLVVGALALLVWLGAGRGDGWGLGAVLGAALVAAFLVTAALAATLQVNAFQTRRITGAL